jgi:hypothetical protein
MNDGVEYNKKFLRLKEMPLYTTSHFTQIMDCDNYVYIEKANQWIENLFTILEKTPTENIVFLSSNPFRIASAINCKFSTVPITSFTPYIGDDY